jgi:hypothetical protein
VLYAVVDFKTSDFDTKPCLETLTKSHQEAVEKLLEIEQQIAAYPNHVYFGFIDCSWFLDSKDVKKLKVEREQVQHEVNVWTMMVYVSEDATPDDRTVKESLSNVEKLSNHLSEIDKKSAALRWWQWGYSKKKALYEAAKQRINMQIERLTLLNAVEKVNEAVGESAKVDQARALCAEPAREDKLSPSALFVKFGEVYAKLKIALQTFVNHVDQKQALKQKWALAQSATPAGLGLKHKTTVENMGSVGFGSMVSFGSSTTVSSLLQNKAGVTNTVM